MPRALGGFGCNMVQLASLRAASAAQGCAASGVVPSTHLIEVACLAPHGLDSPWFSGVLEKLVAEQTLIASVTCEICTFGDTRFTLTATSRWYTLGMRGTCRPGGRLVASAGVEQIVPDAFAGSSAQSMVAYSHILWAALWWGIVADAVGRAATFVRGEARNDPGTIPAAAGALAQAVAELHTLQQLWTGCAAAFDAVGDDPIGRDTLMTMGWTPKLNRLKRQASEAAPRIVHQALQIIGVMGYKNNSKFTVGRHCRDSLSAALMISNERLAAKSAAMLLVVKEV